MSVSPGLGIAVSKLAAPAARVAGFGAGGPLLGVWGGGRASQKPAHGLPSGDPPREVIDARPVHQEVPGSPRERTGGGPFRRKSGAHASAPRRSSARGTRGSDGFDPAQARRRSRRPAHGARARDREAPPPERWTDLRLARDPRRPRRSVVRGAQDGRPVHLDRAPAPGPDQAGRTRGSGSTRAAQGAPRA